MRDTRKPKAYWDEWISYEEGHIPEMWKVLREPGGDSRYAPQYAFEIFKASYELMLMRYSRGDAVSELKPMFFGLLESWEESERLGREVWDEKTQHIRHAWAVNLDQYIRCFWLTGLALALNISEQNWRRLLALMGNEGEDSLLDRVIASRELNRRVGENLCFPKAFKGLEAVVDASVASQPKLLQSYLQNWFANLKNAGSPSMPRELRTPYWWEFCANEELGAKGGYFGCWCIESVAVVKAFGIDDSIVASHPNYPRDLLRNGLPTARCDSKA